MPGGSRPVPPVEKEVLERFYRDLEDAFRGAAGVADRVRGYLPWVAPYLGELVVDLGCGRGDWLMVAQGHGHRVLGVEPSAALAEEAVARGVPVAVADGLEWLRAQPDASVAVVSALHVLEHLPFAAVLAWLIEAFRVVRPGGLVFFETPNPENAYVATHHFFNDPTHLRPLTPELLAFALRWAGFDAVEVVRLHPLPGRIEASDPAAERLNGWLHGAQDFCVRGVKR
jgi:O-antigen chain-terminating methyltransferase